MATQSDGAIAATSSKPDKYRVCTILLPRSTRHVLPDLTPRSPRKERALPQRLVEQAGPDLLAMMPVELIVEICLYHLDFKSLVALHQVDRRTRAIVDDMHEYRIVTKHASDVLWRSMQMRMNGKQSLAMLHKALCQQKCSICQTMIAHGLYMPTLERNCHPCLNAKQYRMIWKRDVKMYLPEYEQAWGDIPTYGLRELKLEDDFPGGYASWYELEPAPAMLLSTLAQRLAPHLEETKVKDWLPHFKYYISFPGDRYTYARLPFFNSTTGQIIEDLACAGCRAYRRSSGAYTPTELRHHIGKCEHADRLWKDTAEGSYETTTLTQLRLIGNLGPGLPLLGRKPSKSATNLFKEPQYHE